MRSPACAVCVVGLILGIAWASSSSSPVYEVQLDWKNALMPCTCSGETVDCSYRRKTTIDPENVCDISPTVLNLYNNLLVTFTDSFASFTSVNASRNRLSALPCATHLNPLLTVLDLSRNVISNATNELRDLSSLEVLDLSVNYLSHLRFLPQSCALKRLDVSYNSLVDLEGPLSQCSQLKELNLKNNKLILLPSGIFNGLSHLENLQLDDNSIGNVITSQIFDNLLNLKKLDLYNIDLTCFPSGIFKSLSKLEKLDIGLNDLSSLPNDIFSSLSNLKALGMIRGNMQTFPTEIFSPLTHLETLHLSVNFFTTLPSDGLIHLSNLKTLTLSFLNATSLPDGFLSNLTELEVLSLYGNQLTSLPDNLLVGLNKLENVDISANRWTEIPLQQLGNAKQVILSNLGINTLEPRMFAITPRVNVLAVNFNNISVVAENAFDGLNLEGLILNNNALIELLPNVFQGQVMLKFIDLSRNMIVSLPEQIFSGLHNLLILELANNKLQAFPNQIFQPLSALQVLDLSGNELTTVSAELFTNLRSLRKLALDRNRLTVLPSVSHAHVAQLHVSFKGNAVSRPDQQSLRLWLSGEEQCFVDLTDNVISPSAVRWILNEQQMLLEADALSPCDCGFVRHRRTVLRLCGNSTCPSWVDAIRNTRE